MSERATVWASDQVTPCGRSKQVLMRLGAYANDGGESWVAVATLAEEIQASERQVQRLLRKLEAAGFIAPTGRFKYRNIPYYQLELSRVGELARRRAERRAQAAREAANGDMDVTVGGADGRANGDVDVTLRRANGDICAANGDMGVTLNELDEKESADALSARARSSEPRDDEGDAPTAERQAFERIEAAWAAKAPDRVAPPVDRRAWLKALGKIGPAELAHAAMRYLEESADVARGRCKALSVWLAEERWVGWLGAKPADDAAAAGAAASASPAPSFDGPDELVAEIRAAKDAAWFGSWLAPCRWNAADRVIETRTGIAEERIRRDLAPVLQRHGVTVRKAVIA